MCGRYFIQESPLLEPVLEAMNRSPLMPRFRERGDAAGAREIRPAQVAPVIALSRSGRQTVFPMRWEAAADQRANGNGGGAAYLPGGVGQPPVRDSGLVVLRMGAHRGAGRKKENRASVHAAARGGGDRLAVRAVPHGGGAALLRDSDPGARGEHPVYS